MKEGEQQFQDFSVGMSSAELMCLLELVRSAQEGPES